MGRTGRELRVTARVAAIAVLVLLIVVGAVPNVLRPFLPGPVADVGRAPALALGATDRAALRADFGGVVEDLPLEDLVALREGRTDIAPPDALPVAVQESGDRCYEVLVLGARGSGEPTEERHGLGLTVATAVATIGERLTGRDLAVSGLEYPAEPIATLVDSPQTYLDGIERGVDRAVEQLARRAELCPAEASVLVGFSQGAMVMHRAVDRLAAEAPDVLDRVAGVLLIADGDRFPTEEIAHYGSAESRVGHVGVGHIVSAGQAGGAIPAALHGRVVSVCDAGDPVCDPRSVSLDAYERHTGYKVGHREARDAAEHVAALAAEFVAAAA